MTTEEIYNRLLDLEVRVVSLERQANAIKPAPDRDPNAPEWVKPEEKYKDDPGVPKKPEDWILPGCG